MTYQFSTLGILTLLRVKIDFLPGFSLKKCMSTQIVYLIQPSNHVGTQVYKIGYAESEKGLKVYGIGTRYLIIKKSVNAVFLKKTIRNAFKNKFQDVGNSKDYFRGSERVMIDTFREAINEITFKVRTTESLNEWQDRKIDVRIDPSFLKMNYQYLYQFGTTYNLYKGIDKADKLIIPVDVFKSFLRYVESKIEHNFVKVPFNREIITFSMNGNHVILPTHNKMEVFFDEKKISEKPFFKYSYPQSKMVEKILKMI